MPVVKLPDGTTAIVCHDRSRQRKQQCSVCGLKVTNVKLCDFRRTEQDATCDAVLCRACAVHQNPDTDYCPHHAKVLGVR